MAGRRWMGMTTPPKSWIKKRIASVVVLVLAIIIATAALTGVYWVVYDELPPIIPTERSEVAKQLADFSLSTDLLFAYNSSVLRDEALNRLDTIAQYLGEHPQYSIEVAGHADSTGDSDYNLALSERRAAAVVGYLVEAGTANPLESVGFGETQPAESNNTEEGRAANRRVTFGLGE